jgi:dihydropteroate synthase
MSKHHVRALYAGRDRALHAELARTLATGAPQADINGVVIESTVIDTLHGLALAVEELDADLLNALTTAVHAHGGVVSSAHVPSAESVTTAIIAGSLSSLDRTAATLMGADATLDAGALRAAMRLGAELSFVLNAVGRNRYVAPTLTLGKGRGRRQWRWGERTYVMGIVNCTPDSFSGDGLLSDRTAKSGPALAPTQSPTRTDGDEKGHEKGRASPTRIDSDQKGRGSPTRVDGDQKGRGSLTRIDSDQKGRGSLTRVNDDQNHPIALAIRQAHRFLEQGADIIDIGGESTRPGGEPVDAATELSRVLPVIEALCASDAPPPISIDTYKAEVARAALDAGAIMVNDVWGLRRDPEMAPLIAERGVPVVIMHNRSKPDEAALAELGGRYIGSRYDNLLADILRELDDQVGAAIAAGIDKAQILIDPGIGFGKTVSQNLALLNHVDQLRSLGLPILLGSSRKSFIGYTLDLPQDQRIEGTAATLAVGIARGGVDVVRVHDVQAMTRVTRMADAIVQAH